MINAKQKWIASVAIVWLTTGTLRSPPAAEAEEAVAQWLSRLADASPQVRLSAAYDFEAGEADVGRHVPALLEALEHEDPFVRRAAAAALGELRSESSQAAEPALGEQIGPVVASLAGALADPHDTVRAHAALALAKLGEPAVPALLDVFRDGIAPEQPRDETAAPTQSVADLRPSELERPVNRFLGHGALPSDYAGWALARIGAPALPGLVALARVKQRAFSEQEQAARFARMAAELDRQLQGWLSDPVRREIALQPPGDSDDAEIDLEHLESLLAEFDRHVRFLLESEMPFELASHLEPLGRQLERWQQTTRHSEIDSPPVEAAVAAERPQDLPPADVRRLYRSLEQFPQEMIVLQASEPLQCLTRIRYVVGHMDRSVSGRLGHLLEDPDPGIRALALSGLGSVTADDAAIIPAVVGQLTSPEPALRKAAEDVLRESGTAGFIDIARAVTQTSDAEALARLFPLLSAAGRDAEVPPEVIAVIARRLDHPSPLVRWHILRTLGSFGRGAARVLPTLILRLDDSHVAVRRQAASSARAIVVASGHPGQAILESLLAALEQSLIRVIDYPEEVEIAGDLVDVVAAVGGDEAAAELIRLLEQRNLGSSLRRRIATALGRMADNSNASNPAPLIGALLRVAQDNSEEDPVRIAAAESLGRFGTRAESAVTVLTRVARDGDGSPVQLAAAASLGRIGAPAKSAIPDLVALLQKERPNHMPPAEALVRIGDAGVQAALALLQDAEQPEYVTEAVCRALGDSEEVDEDAAAERLIAMARRDDAALRIRAALCLAELKRGGEVAAPILAEAYRNDPERSYRYLTALTGLGEAAAPYVAGLIETSEGEQLGRLLESLGKIGSDDPHVLATLATLLNHRDGKVRVDSARALAEIAPASDAPAEALARHLDDQDGYIFEPVGAAVAAALVRMGPAAAGVTPQVAEFLTHDDPEVRRRAANVIQAAGVPSDEAAAARVEGALVRALVDGDLRVRHAAAEALAQTRVVDDRWEPLLVSALYDHLVQQLAQQWMRDIPRLAFPDPAREMATAGRGVRSYGLPKFPWPPPKPSQAEVVPRRLLGSDETTLAEIRDRLHNALRTAHADFTYGLFELAPHADGFVLLARIERIHRDGTPFPPEERFDLDRVPPLNLADYLRELFMQRPGHFRLIAFVITDTPIAEWSREPVPDPGRGGQVLPQELGQKNFAGMHPYVLIYTFEKPRGGAARPLRYSEFSAETHLRRAGLWNVLDR